MSFGQNSFRSPNKSIFVNGDFPHTAAGPVLVGFGSAGWQDCFPETAKIASCRQTAVEERATSMRSTSGHSWHQDFLHFYKLYFLSAPGILILPPERPNASCFKYFSNWPLHDQEKQLKVLPKVN